MALKPAKKIILVSSGQPSLNPRLVKEADSLSEMGYDVTVFYAYWNNWGTEYDKQLLATRTWNAIRVGGSPREDRLTYLTSRIIYKMARAIKLPLFASAGLSRASFALLREVKKHTADLYIAHNLGALPAVVIAAQKHKKPCGFDAEDFHRNETTDDQNNDEVKRKSSAENNYIPQLSYITVSSPQIGAAYKRLFPVLHPVVLLNVFNKSDVIATKVHSPLKLFWFSQTIGTGRGIEDVVKALSMLKKEDFELHLLGDRPEFSKDFIEELSSANLNIKFHDPVAPDEVIPFAAQFDIGLAIEKNTPLNRDLCLTNKIFTYMQAGLCVIASQTTAQAAFMQQSPDTGCSYPNGDIKALASILSHYQQQPDGIMACKEASLKLANERYNWETESQKFLKLIREII
jgi:glycosyltransferase involved in cell wall biosynthesis